MLTLGPGRGHGLELGLTFLRFALDNRARPVYWLRIFALFGWVLIIPPITPATEGLYVGSDSRPAEVGITVPLFQWTVYGRYQAAAECERTQSQLQMRSLQMNPENATAVAYSFAKCLEDNDQRLHPDNGSATW